VRTAPPSFFREPEERAKGRYPRPDGFACISLVANHLEQQFIHLGDGQLAELQAGGIDVCEEVVDGPAPLFDGIRRKPTIAEHVIGELDNLIDIGSLDRGGWL
jgi:hypothetical protein